MQKRAPYRPLVFGAAALTVVGLVAFFVLSQTIKWVGHTDLEVRFVVTDAETSQPIPNATIHIRTEPGGFCDDREEHEFTIATDDNGHAKHMCKNCMCVGSKGTFEDTFAVHLPWWWFHATVTGYSDTDPAYLDVQRNAQQVQRGKPFATISIPIRLRKNAG